MIKWIVNKYLPYLKVWGCHIEFEDRPPQVVVSKHGYERMVERFRCSDKKVQKVAMKAWLHGKDIPPHKIKRQEEGKIYKEYLGHCFVFAKRWLNKWTYQHVLITVWQPNTYYIKL